ncbi:beta-galactosidase-like isoform X2 [Lineus longissimus]|uniref:beta-galactosidase-like isoform X2 n=1 Tax=Lineus longissimus TaxID=88925 RepID=UPI00315DCB05
MESFISHHFHAKIVSIVLLAILALWSEKTSATRTFTIDTASQKFYKDGEPFTYVAGSMHYARVPPYYWKDRLLKMKAAGLNAVQFYVPWNFHEPTPGIYDFSSPEKNLVGFLETIRDVGLLAIVRAGPYMCAEWEFGGIPAWLLKDDVDVKLRTDDPAFMMHVYRYTEKLSHYIQPHIYANGGPVIMIQVENEYGSWYACDHDYMNRMYLQFREYMGHDIVLFTTDGDGQGYLKCGSVKDFMYATVDFGITSDVNGSLKVEQDFNKGPLVNSEYYPAWFDEWGGPHANTAVGPVNKTLDDMLKVGASVNIYMFHGGTNFAYMNGAECCPYKPVVTSYDYDAPISEAGDTTFKYMVLRETIGKYHPLPNMSIPANTTKFAYGKVPLKFSSTILDTLWQVSPAGPTKSTYPINMERLLQYYGFVYYRVRLTKSYTNANLSVPGIRDRGYVMLNSVPQGVLQVGDVTVLKNFTAKANDFMDILVENQGRVNFGKGMLGQIKGLISNVTVNKDLITGWYNYPINLVKAAGHTGDQTLRFRHFPRMSFDTSLVTPSLYVGSFLVDKSMTPPADTFLKTSGWTKGQAFVNGHNLGRYWPVKGPQITLYVPSSFLKPYPAKNHVMFFELEKAPCTAGQSCMVEFVDSPILNGKSAFNSTIVEKMERDARYDWIKRKVVRPGA